LETVIFLYEIVHFVTPKMYRNLVDNAFFIHKFSNYEGRPVAPAAPAEGVGGAARPPPAALLDPVPPDDGDRESEC